MSKQALLLHHFGTKKKLYGEVLKEISTRYVARLVAKNTRNPDAIIGDMDAQTQAIRIADHEVMRCVTNMT